MAPTIDPNLSLRCARILANHPNPLREVTVLTGHLDTTVEGLLEFVPIRGSLLTFVQVGSSMVKDISSRHEVIPTNLVS